MRCTIITDLSIDLYSWETAWFLMPGVVEQLAMVNVNRSELGSVDNIPQWGSSRLKRRRKCSRGREERKESRIRTDRERKWKENGKIWREKRNLRRSGRMMSELTCNTEERGRERERERRERERERERGRMWEKKGKPPRQLSRTLKEFWQIYEHGAPLSIPTLTSQPACSSDKSCRSLVLAALFIHFSRQQRILLRDRARRFHWEHGECGEEPRRNEFDHLKGTLSAFNHTY